MVYEPQNAPFLPAGVASRHRQRRHTAQAAVGAAILVATAVLLFAGSAQLRGAGTAVNKQSSPAISPDTTKAFIGTLFGNLTKGGSTQPQAGVTVDNTAKGFIGTSLRSGAFEDAETIGNESVVSSTSPPISETVASASVEASPAAPVLALAANDATPASTVSDLLASAQSAKPALAVSEKAFFGRVSPPVPTPQAVAFKLPNPQTSAKQTQAPARPVPASAAGAGNATASAFDRSKVTPEMVAKKQEMDQLAASILTLTPHSQEYTVAREKLKDAKVQLGQMKEARKAQLEKVNADRTAALAAANAAAKQAKETKNAVKMAAFANKTAAKEQAAKEKAAQVEAINAKNLKKAEDLRAKQLAYVAAGKMKPSDVAAPPANAASTVAMVGTATNSTV